MKICMRCNKIGVEKVKKSSKKNDGIIMPEVTDSLGIIRYIGKDVSTDLSVGMKVFYGTTRTQIRMGDADIEVMESDNIFAIVEDSPNEESKEITPNA